MARDGEGRRLAVKVQHEQLRSTAVHDMRAVTLVVDVVAKLFEEFSYKCQWVCLGCLSVLLWLLFHWYVCQRVYVGV